MYVLPVIFLHKKNSRTSFRKAGAFILKMTIAFLYLADYTIP